jgi:hypothetical protein
MATHSQYFQDKRSFPRYQTRDSSALMLMPGNVVSYSLLDVSKSGLSFCYYGESIKSEALDKAIVTFFSDNVGSSDISVQIISDTELNNDNLRQPLSEKENSKIPCLRRCGVKFIFVSEDQEDAINKYIEGLGTN